MTSRTIIASFALIGFVGQFLLYFFNHVSFNNLGFIAGFSGCVVTFVVCFFSQQYTASKLQKSAPTIILEKVEKSLYVKIINTLYLILLYSLFIWAVLVFYTRNEIIAILCFVFTVIFAGFSIFTVFSKRKI